MECVCGCAVEQCIGATADMARANFIIFNFTQLSHSLVIANSQLRTKSAQLARSLKALWLTFERWLLSVWEGWRQKVSYIGQRGETSMLNKPIRKTDPSKG